MAVETDSDHSLDARTIVAYLRGAMYVLVALLGLSLLLVGTVAVIAELKGTWHWSIHLESTISYMAVFVSRLLFVLVPLFVLVAVGRKVVDDA